MTQGSLRRPRLRRWILGAMFLAWPLALLNPTGTPMSDAVLLTALRLAEHGTFTLVDEGDPEIVALTMAHDISVHEGRITSGLAPGASVLAMPFAFVLQPAFTHLADAEFTNRRVAGYYWRNAIRLGVPRATHFNSAWILQWVLVAFVMAPLFASSLVSLESALRARGAPPATALLAIVAIGLGSLTLAYTCTWSRQGLAALLAWHAFAAVVVHPKPGRWAYLLAGACGGLAITVDYPAALPVGLVLLAAWPRADGRARIELVLPVLAFGGLLALFHWQAFGSPFETPYHHRYWPTSGREGALGLDMAALHVDHAVGMNLPSPKVMLALCFGPFKGLLLHSPILLLGLAGHLAALRHVGRRGLAAFCLVGFLVQLAFNSTLGTHVPREAHHFWGGLTVLWGPRFLLPAVAFLAVGLAGIDWNRRPVRWLALVLLTVSCALNVAGAAASNQLAFGTADDLRFPAPFVLRLLLTRGPRLEPLEILGVTPGVQAAVLVALVAGTVLTVVWMTRSNVPVSTPASQSG